VTLGLQWVGPHYIKGVLLFMFLCVVFCMYIHMSMCIYICVCVCLCTHVSMCVLLQLLLLNDLFKSWSAKNHGCLGPLLGSLEVVHVLIPIDTVFMCNIWVLTLSMYTYIYMYIRIFI
jgi:hypothetical protein